jgi:hypothetical protein
VLILLGSCERVMVELGDASNAPRTMGSVATSQTPWPVDLKLVQEIHFRWFETTFRTDAEQFRTQMVLNRKGTAVQVEAILPAIQGACDNWNWRRDHHRPTHDLDPV